jgi:hypothetical protein
MITRDQRQAKLFKLACGIHRAKFIYMAIKTWKRFFRRPKSLIMQDHLDAKNRLKSQIN